MSRLNMNETIRQLIDYFGTQIATAEALGASQATVSGWLHNVHGMSPVTAMRAERVTRGKVKAAELCPSLASVQEGIQVR